MKCQFMFCFHFKTRDFEREGRFFHGGRKLFGTTLKVKTSTGILDTKVFMALDTCGGRTSVAVS